MLNSFWGFPGTIVDLWKISRRELSPLYDIIGQAPRKRGRKPANSTDPEFVWAEQQQEAFNTLKDKLTYPPVLGYARPDCPFVLYTDASGKGLGAVLSQKQDGVERVISYARI